MTGMPFGENPHFKGEAAGIGTEDHEVRRIDDPMWRVDPPYAGTTFLGLVEDLKSEHLLTTVWKGPPEGCSQQ